METNDINTSVATPLFSWGDYWKVFFVLLGFIPMAFFILKYFQDEPDLGILFIFSITLIFPIIMGEALLAFVFSKIKDFPGIFIIFILHAWAYVILLGLIGFWKFSEMLISGVTINSDDGGFFEILMIIFWAGSGIFPLFYGLMRMTRWNILRRKYPGKSFSLIFVRWFLAHAVKIYVVLAMLLILAHFLWSWS